MTNSLFTYVEVAARSIYRQPTRQLNNLALISILDPYDISNHIIQLSYKNCDRSSK